jgi:hypothetical protein
VLDSSLPFAKTAKIARDMDEAECKRRNALSRTQPGFRLNSGDTVAVVETLDNNGAFLVEVESGQPDRAAWMGVVYAREIELT